MRASNCLFFAALLTLASTGAALADSTGVKGVATPPAVKSQSASAYSASKTPATPDHATKAQAVAMVKLVQTSFKKYGLKEIAAAINDPLNKDFHKGDLYAFIITFKGLMIAHGGEPALDGRNLYGLKDPDGKYINKDMAQLAENGGGWYDYRWPNFKTHMIDGKATFVQKLNQTYFVGAGVYREPK